MAERYGEQYDSSPYLPPREYWLFDPEKDDPLTTPVDGLGLVKKEELIALVKSKFDPSYSWKSPLKDEHHLYWEDADYPDAEVNGVNPAKFRRLRRNRIIVPRGFHEVVHDLTVKPPVPDEEVMHYVIEEQRLLTRIFSSARDGARLTRTRYITDKRLRRGEEFHINDYYSMLEIVHDTLPEEFQPKELDNLLPGNIEELRMIVPVLGRLAMTGKYVRHIAQPIAA
jgi:hypothetical protein